MTESVFTNFIFPISKECEKLADRVMRGTENF